MHVLRFFSNFKVRPNSATECKKVSKNSSKKNLRLNITVPKPGAPNSIISDNFLFDPEYNHKQTARFRPLVQLEIWKFYQK